MYQHPLTVRVIRWQVAIQTIIDATLSSTRRPSRSSTTAVEPIQTDESFVLFEAVTNRSDVIDTLTRQIGALAV